MSTSRRNTNAPHDFLIVILVLSIICAYLTFPQKLWRIEAAMSVLALISLLLSVGWGVPCTIAGVYAGMFFEPSVGGGTIETQMHDFAFAVFSGAFVDFMTGVFLDACRAAKSRRNGENSGVMNGDAANTVRHGFCAMRIK